MKSQHILLLLLTVNIACTFYFITIVRDVRHKLDHVTQIKRELTGLIGNLQDMRQSFSSIPNKFLNLKNQIFKEQSAK